MSSLELIGKIIADGMNYGSTIEDDSHHQASLQRIENSRDFVIVASDNTSRFKVHQVVVESRWPAANSLLGKNNELFIDLSSQVVPFFIDYLYYRSLQFSSLDDALELYRFSETIQDDTLTKTCLQECKHLMTPEDVLKVWNYSQCHRFRNTFVDYVTYHLPLIFETSEAVREQFNAMSLPAIGHLMKQRKLNLHSERDLSKFAMSWIDGNAGKCDPEEVVTFIFSFVRCRRADAKHVLPVLELLNDKYDIAARCPRLHFSPRLPRDLFLMFGLYDKKHPIAYRVDIDGQKVTRLHSLDNRDFAVSLPNFCVAGENVYQIGGLSSSALSFPKADCFVLDKHAQKWRRRASILHERAYSSVCGSPCGLIFVVGGHSLQARNRMRNVEMYNTKENVWKQLPRMATGRMQAASIFINGNLIVTGGCNDDQTFDHCEYMAKNSDTWTILPPMCYPRAGHQLVAYDGYLYAIGGRTVETNRLAEVERIPLTLDGTWKLVSSMTLKRCIFAAEVFDGKLFVFGGEERDADNKSPQSCEYFDGISWHPFCELPPDVEPISSMTWKNIDHPELMAELTEASNTDEIHNQIFNGIQGA